MRPEDRIFVALDTPDRMRAHALASALRGRVGAFKVGLEAFVSNGPSLVTELRERSHRVFLDLKLHDIPNTVAGAAAAAARLGVSYFTVHALGGEAMIARAVDAAATAADGPPPIVLAVTILTSHDEASLDAVGVGGGCAASVTRLAVLARDAGAGGVVCSPLEAAAVRHVFPEAVIVVPGIRSSAAPADDQSRVAGPAEAVRAGADAIVVGRPITQAPDPAAAARTIADDLRRGFGD